MTQQAVSERRAALEKKWGHIMFDRWEQMKWFVTLANTDLTDQAVCSDGDFQNWQDACEAIRMVPIFLSPVPVDRKRYIPTGGGVGSVSPTRLDIENIHEAIAQPLKDLADGVKDRVQFGPVSVSHTIGFRTTNEAQRQAGYFPHVISSAANVTGDSHQVWRGEFMLRAGRLLETFVDNIRRCPHCKRVFVQLRKNATYCGPPCYSVAGMRNLRARRAAEAAQRKAKKGRRTKRASHK
jgi:hypothetical protein